MRAPYVVAVWIFFPSHGCIYDVRLMAFLSLSLTSFLQWLYSLTVAASTPMIELITTFAGNSFLSIALQ